VTCQYYFKKLEKNMSQHFALKAMIIVFDQNSYRNFNTKKSIGLENLDRQRDKIKN